MSEVDVVNRERMASCRLCSQQAMAERTALQGGDQPALHAGRHAGTQALLAMHPADQAQAQQTFQQTMPASDEQLQLGKYR